ncbi:efflux RND transporter periplasmic adaptor subunit [Geopsychrobacter electrodiphilus]|uniref:efflux RND transporter periplasmic adaptor subunit n=1 Tax=Geopsychrobacter electrodiphilus TaxID=225196 RepID=UPI000377FCC6|nr:efflux RND transporter periplasmic adaptor subunit [Geopsychrobacter electrodiphilus]
MKHPRLFWGGLTLLLLLLIAGTLMFFTDGMGSDPASKTYVSTPVRRGVFERTVSSTGTLAAVETVTVGTEVSGTIDQVRVDFNDHVKKGEVLATLKPDLFNAAVADARATVDKATADLAQAERELERNQPLFAQGYLSEQEILPLRYNVDRGRASLASAQASLSRASINQRNSTIRSPIAGTVIQRSVDAGQTVAASLNTPTLFIIARDLSRMQIEADVDETDIGQIHPDQAVRFSVQSYPERNFTGRVRQVRLQSKTVQSVVTYTVIVSADNPDRLLLPGMTATVDFVVEHLDDSLLVPTSALRFAPEEKKPGTPRKKRVETDNQRVYRLQGTAQLEPVKVKLISSDGQHAAVSSEELKVGDLIVTALGQEDKTSKKSFSLFGAMRGKPKR